MATKKKVENTTESIKNVIPNEKSNARRFIDAFNNIDYALKARYNLNRAMGFSDLIRKSVVVNYVVRKYEDVLVDYGRLRNAIVHSSKDDFVIAEPHIDVVENIEHIERLLTTPPKALDTVGRRDVLVTYAGHSMRDVITLMSQSNYSNIPVYKNNELIGIANGQKILDCFGQFLIAGGKADVFLDHVQIEDMLSSIENSDYYVVKPVDCTVEEALAEFNKNRKLMAILFTKHGIINEMPMGIMTGANVVDAQKILEQF
ncbi:MAG: CBS domain-containing protein [Clostridia bacterium]|nr:CBS domain-containing protein [Clostridia bacterium]